MNTNFFSQEATNQAIRNYLEKISNADTQSDFDVERNEHLSTILNSMIKNKTQWDNDAPVFIKRHSEDFMALLTERSMHNDRVDIVYAIAFNLILEYYLNSHQELGSELESIKKFTINNIDNFSDFAKPGLKYSLYELPLYLMKRLISGEEARAIKLLSSTIEKAEELKKKWDGEIELKKREVEKLQSTLDRQNDAFNFVGLYAGFSKIGKMKSEEYKWSKITLFTLGASMPIIIAASAVTFIKLNIQLKETIDLIKLIPSTSITILLFYYFRVTLSNYNSIRAQTMQIELRKSLCRFIQRYAEYSKEIKSKDANLLVKFEEVIFSNIMVSPEKIPSTFDGLEQMAALIKSLKGGN
ncbi:hypothetical protein [Erwinia sp. Leaf53]|uniref:hypothetical protein n=1 Tax=Erwinia sp. Leaf53 TaxID=1736225 RepID=UPI0006FA17B8|nr:hypothetical protein [Erwinia sp. Leaf53]KQN57998.1 hypothetical protein ASF13_04175 [Erwinia sp. Leaf53]